MMQAVAARAAASAAAAAALVASATAFASRASTSVLGARLFCTRPKQQRRMQVTHAITQQRDTPSVQPNNHG